MWKSSLVRKFYYHKINSGVLGLIKQFVIRSSFLQWMTRFARKATIPLLNTKAKLLDKVRSTTDQSQSQVRDGYS